MGPKRQGLIRAVPQSGRDLSAPVPLRRKTPKETHYKTHFVTAVRDDNAQEHSLSLVEYPEAIRFGKKEKKNLAFGGPGRPAGPAGPGNPQNFIFSA